METCICVSSFIGIRLHGFENNRKIYIYIYIYICVCCYCVYAQKKSQKFEFLAMHLCLYFNIKLPALLCALPRQSA